MRIIGLTGGTAAGKSTVAAFLNSKYNVPILNVSQISEKVTEPGSPVLAKIVLELGDEILNANGAIDKTALKERIIDDDQARASLQTIIVSAIQSWVAETLQRLELAGQKIVVIDNGNYEKYSEAIVVACSADNQLQRLLNKGLNEKRAKAVMLPQPVLKDGLTYYNIENNGNLDDLSSATEALWGAINEL